MAARQNAHNAQKQAIKAEPGSGGEQNGVEVCIFTQHIIRHCRMKCKNSHGDCILINYYKLTNLTLYNIKQN